MSIRRPTSSAGIKFSSRTILFTRGIIDCDYLVISGGAGGFNTAVNTNCAGGGGAGGYITSIAGESSGGGESNSPINIPYRLYKGSSYSVTVGAGGASGAAGSASTIGILSPIGGGQGIGEAQQSLRNGGANASSGNVRKGAYGTLPNLYPGGDSFGSTTATLRAGGGGGGAGSAGSNGTSGVGGNGGSGLASTITGSSVTRAGGGAGNCANTTTQGTGGSGGGGNSAYNGTAGSGTVNTGSGGGGQSGSGSAGAGGSGLIVIKYLKQWSITADAGLTLSTTTSGSYKITEFTAGTGNIVFS